MTEIALNQCDGCVLGLPVRDGIHEGPHGYLIGCTAHLYAEQVSMPTPADAAVPRKYRKKPVVIEAVQLCAAGEDESPEVVDWLHANLPDGWEGTRDEGIDIPTLEGVMHASPGDWIIKGVKGECYPCKPDIFEATYEAV